MCQANSNQGREGYVLSVIDGFEYMLRRNVTEVWPVYIEDPGKGFSEPYPRYKGSARSEGAPDDTFHGYWLKKQGFQPCVLELEYAKMRNKDGEIANCRVREDKLRVAALVRYASRLYQDAEIRIITVDANAATQEKYSWARQPVVITGEDSAARREKLVKFVKSLRTREDDVEPEPESPHQEAIQTELAFENVPF